RLTSPWLPVSFMGMIAVAVLPIAFVSAQTPAVVAQVQAPASVQPQLAVAVESAKSVPDATPVMAPAVEAASIEAVVAGELSDQDHAELANKIAAIRRQIETTRDSVAAASQQGAEQSQIDELRKKIAALEAELARVMVEQRGGVEAKKLTAEQE